MKLVHDGKVISICLPICVFHFQNYSVNFHFIVAFHAKGSDINPPLSLLSSMFIFVLSVQCNLTLHEAMTQVQQFFEEQLRVVHGMECRSD